LALLEVTDLKVHFETDDGIVKAVDGVSYTVERGQALGIVGESGSGKSVSSLTVMGLTRFARNARISGSITFDGTDLLNASDESMRRLRGNDIAMIFQDPLSSLHPFYKIGDQLVEAIQAHRDVSKAQALDRAVEMLGLVGIPEPRRRIDSYPHEFSGGMRQRVMIAMALINDPKLLIADEPTTALDVTVQAQILDLIQRLQRELDTAIVMITHDLGVVAEVTDDIAVMYAGRIVEYAEKETIFAMPEHPYTWGLLKSIPRLDSPRGEDLVPIPGRPPSLILKPPGCSFHPRCPYVREAHKRIDPQLAPAAEGANGGGHKHQVACLLPGATRRALWAALQEGVAPETAMARVDVPDKVVDQEAVGEVLAAPGTEVAEGVVATDENTAPPPAIEVAPEEAE
jgi:peptide/nickel transport system ATP-binding protein